MMKKIQMKKNQQKKFQTNPRSSSSLGVLNPFQQSFFQGQSQLAVSPTGQLSTKNQIQKAQIMSKLQRDGKQQLGQLHQSANLNGLNSFQTNENGQESENQKIIGKKKILKTQRSCEFIVYNQNQSPIPGRSIDDNEIEFLNQGFPSPNNKSKTHYLKQSTTKFDQNGPNSYLKQSKMNQTTDFAGQKFQRQFQSPLNKRTQQNQQQKQNASNQQGNSRLEMSPSLRASTAISKQGFYSPQASSTSQKFNNGAQSFTNRRNNIENDQKRFLERKKVDTSALGGQVISNKQNGSYTTTAASEKNQSGTNTQFQNPNNISHSNNYLVQSQIVKQSNGFQASNTSMSNVNRSYQAQPKINSNSNNEPNQKKKDNYVIHINNNKYSELDELDLQIQTIEREIERDNELVDKQYANSYHQSKKQSVQINNKNTPKPKQSKIQAVTPSHHLSTDQGVLSSGQNKSNQIRHSTHDKASTTTHKQAVGSPSFNVYSPKYSYLSSETSQLRKSQVHNSDRNEFNNYGQPSNIQSRTIQDFSKAKLIQSDHHGFSQESSSYTNTPRQMNQIHEFRPIIKQSKKQVNFKRDDRVNTQDSQESYIEKYSQASPTYFQTPNNQYPTASPLNLSLPSGMITPKELNLYQLNNTNNQKPINSNRRNQINTQGSNQSLKFQKKNIAGQQYSQNSNSNFQNSLEGTDGDDHEISEFEYLEKIINAKNNESSSQITDDQSSQKGNAYELYGKNKISQAEPSQKKHKSTLIQQQKGQETEKMLNTKQSNSNREISIPQNLQNTSTDSSPFQILKQNKAINLNYLNLKQSDIPSSQKPITSRDNTQINVYQQPTSTSRSQQPIKVQLKTLENNFIINTDQDNKYNNYFNNRNSDLINKNNNNNSNLSNLNNGTSNMNSNATRTPSASSNNISTISQNNTPQTQGSQSTSSLNKGIQLQMSNKQKNNPNIHDTYTLGQFKNKKGSDRIANQDPIHSSLIRNEAPKKSNLKQTHFEDEKEEIPIEQMSKNLHKKLNYLLETANQCNENMKSYRINNNN